MLMWRLCNELLLYDASAAAAAAAGVLLQLIVGMELMMNLSFTMVTHSHQKSRSSLPLIASVNMHLKLPSK